MFDNPNRYKISVVFGYGHIDWNVHEFFRHLEEEITKDFGGCRVSQKRGLWRADGNDSGIRTGELFEEDTMEVTILTDLDPQEFLWIVKSAVKFARDETEGDVPMEWVNVEFTQVEQGHFNMQAL